MISTLPVWNVLRVVPESALPDWYTAQIRFLGPGPPADLVDRPLPGDARGAVHALDPREISHLAARADEPALGLLLQPVGDGPGDRARRREPDGRRRDHPRAQGAATSATSSEMFELFEERPQDDVPGAARTAYWRRRHLVHDPSFGVIQKPALVGKFRPHWRAPERRRAVLRVRDLPVARHRRRPRRRGPA